MTDETATESKTEEAAPVTAKPETATTETATPTGAAASPPKNEAPLFNFEKLGIINDLNVTLNVEIGRTQIKIRDLLNLSKGSVLELNKQAGEPVDVYVNGKLTATGTIITANGKYCIRLVSMNEKKPEVEKDEQPV